MTQEEVALVAETVLRDEHRGPHESFRVIPGVVVPAANQPQGEGRVIIVRDRTDPAMLKLPGHERDTAGYPTGCMTCQEAIRPWDCTSRDAAASAVRQAFRRAGEQLDDLYAKNRSAAKS